MKKILLIVCLFFLSLQTVYAKDTTFELTDTKGMEGDTITVKLKINNSPSFGILGAKLDYDETKLKYVSSKIIGLDKAMMKDNTESNGIVMMYAFCIDKDNLMDDTGNIFEVKFKIISKEKEQSKIELEITDFAIDEVEPLNYTTKDSTITINQETKTVSVSDFTSLKDEIDSQIEGNIEWKSSNTSVATVDENGNVTFKNSGDVTITAISDDKVVFEKEYEVADKEKNNHIFFITVGICFCVIIIVVVSFFIVKRKKKNETK